MRRLLPLLLAAGLLTLFLFSTFRNVEWRWLPRAFGLQNEGVSLADDGKSAQPIFPNLNTGQAGNANQESDINSISPYPIGKTRPPGSNYTRGLVIAHIKDENVTWVDETLGDMIRDGLLRPAIYVMDDPDAPLHPPANKGHEVMAYLSHIIDRYDDLADVTLFMHYHRYAWHNNELQYTDAAQMIRQLSPERVTRDGYMNLRCHWDPGCPAHLHPGATAEDADKREELVIAESWSQLFPNDPIPTVLAQACCAQFAVSRDRIRALPRDRYVRMRDWALRTELSDYLAGRVFEYVWQVVFSGAAVHCPLMHVCYCDGYGYCFGDPVTFDAWFETRYHFEQYQEELRIWQEKADKIDQWRKGEGKGEWADEALLVVPEVGRDVWLKNKIDELGNKLLVDLREARERGQNPENRAKEAGRPWKEGDGF